MHCWSALWTGPEPEDSGAGTSAAAPAAGGDDAAGGGAPRAATDAGGAAGTSTSGAVARPGGGPLTAPPAVAAASAQALALLQARLDEFCILMGDDNRWGLSPAHPIISWDPAARRLKAARLT